MTTASGGGEPAPAGGRTLSRALARVLVTLGFTALGCLVGALFASGASADVKPRPLPDDSQHSTAEQDDSGGGLIGGLLNTVTNTVSTVVHTVDAVVNTVTGNTGPVTAPILQPPPGQIGLPGLITKPGLTKPGLTKPGLLKPRPKPVVTTPAPASTTAGQVQTVAPTAPAPAPAPPPPAAAPVHHAIAPTVALPSTPRAVAPKPVKPKQPARASATLPTPEPTPLPSPPSVPVAPATFSHASHDNHGGDRHPLGIHAGRADLAPPVLSGIAGDTATAGHKRAPGLPAVSPD
ncbi:hypothetical protein EV193_101527 [Herbihabitans rhizosphaerae]|uniref:Uncharacterized protein n=1 Tax=Herbihabitans rhizosphaerae TaxID=1872711 RepID=A0A4Q7L7N7_9PSEU|nr:hypothetical protein [Herbihabitans rhizosphaerae]RZS44651.1 hypothetical protein EV193_101527 [Herbihabitans rhizosphaerae]